MLAAARGDVDLQVPILEGLKHGMPLGRHNHDRLAVAVGISVGLAVDDPCRFVAALR